MIVAEWMKLRRSPALILAALAPLLVALFVSLIDSTMAYEASHHAAQRCGPSQYVAFYFQVWGVFFFPFLLAVFAYGAWHVERNEAALKLVLAQPIDRGALLLTKVLHVFVLILVGQISMGVMGGIAARLTGLPQAPSIEDFVLRSCLFALGAVPAVALMTVAAYLRAGVLVPMAVAVGIVGVNLAFGEVHDGLFDPFIYSILGSLFSGGFAVVTAATIASLAALGIGYRIARFSESPT